MTRLGKTPDGRPVHEVRIASDRIEAHFMTLGARLVHLSLDGAQGVVPPVDLAGALGDGLFTGALIAPVMNRLANARAPLDGRVLQFDAGGAKHLLHSGPAGTAGRVWDIARHDADAVTFAIRLADGEGGFPGNRHVEAAFRLAGAELALTVTATTDAPTLMNAGFHPYWALSGRGREGQSLEITASRYLPATDEVIPTGEVAAVTGTRFDFRAPRAPGPAIDHCFVPDGEGLRPVLRLTGETGLRLEVLTDAPGLHVYTGHPAGIAIEPERWPDAPNHAGFPSIRLGPGETFRQESRWRLTR